MSQSAATDSHDAASVAAVRRLLEPASVAILGASESLSALTTAASWVFYYKAIHEGEVGTVVIIDKGSFLIAVVLAWLLLDERITLRVAIGSLLVLAGLVVVAWKR